jgi:hypothetical protein
VKKLDHKILAKRKREFEKRWERRNRGNQERPMFKRREGNFTLPAKVITN